MQQSIPCPVCGAPITAHYELFAHVHPSPTASDPVDLEEVARVNLMAWKGRIDTLRAQYYGLGPVPWRSQA